MGRCDGLGEGNRNNNRRNTRGTICTWQVLLQVQGKANAFLLTLVGVIKNHLEGSTMYITGGINITMKVWILPFSIFLDLGF